MVADINNAHNIDVFCAEEIIYLDNINSNFLESLSYYLTLKIQIFGDTVKAIKKFQEKHNKAILKKTCSSCTQKDCFI